MHQIHDRPASGAKCAFSLLGLSPAPVMIVVGVALGQAFLA
jgi:hypothetical protein